MIYIAVGTRTTLMEINILLLTIKRNAEQQAWNQYNNGDSIQKPTRCPIAHIQTVWRFYWQYRIWKTLMLNISTGKNIDDIKIYIIVNFQIGKTCSVSHFEHPFGIGASFWRGTPVCDTPVAVNVRYHWIPSHATYMLSHCLGDDFKIAWRGSSSRNNLAAIARYCCVISGSLKRISCYKHGWLLCKIHGYIALTTSTPCCDSMVRKQSRTIQGTKSYHYDSKKWNLYLTI